MADKQILAKYVHDAVDMETQRHTLNRLRDSLICSRKQRVNEKEQVISYLSENHPREIRTSEYSLRQLEYEYSNESLNYAKRRSSMQEQICSLEENPLKGLLFFANRGSIIWSALLIPWAILALCFLLIAIVGFDSILFNMLFSEDYGSVIIVISFAVLALVCGKINYSIQKSKWKRNILKSSKNDILSKEKELQRIEEEHRNTIARYEQQIDNKQNEHQQLVAKLRDEEVAAKNELIQANNTFNALTPHIETMGKQLDTMESQLNQFYEVNLIPPDYRSLECVIAFDQMFRNDLVDTIREAVLLYEERVFRGEMVKGIENIRRDLQNLSTLMSETISVLRRIDDNTNRMSDQLYTISSDITRMNANVTGHLSTISGNLSSLGSSLDYIADNQQSIASELEYSRYANEAIRANSDRMIWYAEQRRQGLL